MSTIQISPSKHSISLAAWSWSILIRIPVLVFVRFAVSLSRFGLCPGKNSCSRSRHCSNALTRHVHSGQSVSPSSSTLKSCKCARCSYLTNAAMNPSREGAFYWKQSATLLLSAQNTRCGEDKPPTIPSAPKPAAANAGLAMITGAATTAIPAVVTAPAMKRAGFSLANSAVWIILISTAIVWIRYYIHGLWQRRDVLQYPVLRFWQSPIHLKLLLKENSWHSDLGV